MNIRSIAADPPKIATEAVAAAVAEQYGLSGNYRPLVSERDQNFQLQTENGRRYVVKIASLAEDPVVTDFQIEALKYLQASGLEICPQIIRTPDGDDRGVIHGKDDRLACLRIVSWLDGQRLHDAELSADISASFGRQLALLDRALENFSHPGERQVLLWDTQRALELRDLLQHIDDSVTRTLVEEVLDAFAERVLPRLGSLPQQVIHNDANSENILLNEAGKVTGIIDFGDMLRAPRIVEVATAASYLRTSARDPLEYIAAFVAGYHAESALQSSELDLLFDLIRTRLAMTLSILYWRVSARDAGDSYRQKSLASEAAAADFLGRLSALGREAARRRLRAVLRR